MSNQAPTPEQYVTQVKSNIFALTGEINARAGRVIEDLLTNVLNSQAEVGRLRKILDKNNIPYTPEITPPVEKATRIEPPTNPPTQ